jgi:hypothetical protein
MQCIYYAPCIFPGICTKRSGCVLPATRIKRERVPKTAPRRALRRRVYDNLGTRDTFRSSNFEAGGFNLRNWHVPVRNSRVGVRSGVESSEESIFLAIRKEYVAV